MFDNYINDILDLKSFEKKDILNDRFLLIKEKNMEIYYAPHNEIINEDAKVFIIGITPGWTQTKIAYETAQKCLLQNLGDKYIKKECKRNLNKFIQRYINSFLNIKIRNSNFI